MNAQSEFGYAPIIAAMKNTATGTYHPAFFYKESPNSASHNCLPHPIMMRGTDTLEKALVSCKTAVLCDAEARAAVRFAARANIEWDGDYHSLHKMRVFFNESDFEPTS